MEMVDWAQGLAEGEQDEKVGIKMLKLTGDEAFSSYLTVIDSGKAVTPHYHRHGTEHYHIISGRGVLSIQDVATGNCEEVAVRKQCSFQILENTVHSLQNTGDAPLVLMFSCPAAHLASDRYFLQNP